MNAGYTSICEKLVPEVLKTPLRDQPARTIKLGINNPTSSII